MKNCINPRNFFVLRNNDLGDVLVATPLLKGLKKAFPESKVSIGVGDWAKPLLENNPFVDEVIACNGPWHNKQNCRFPANSPKTFLEGILYVLFSKESRYISSKKFTHGLDVLDEIYRDSVCAFFQGITIYFIQKIHSWVGCFG